MKPDPTRIIAMWFTGCIAIIGMSCLSLSAFYKIYIEPVMMIVLSNITIAAVSSFTTLLTGRTVAQLNQNSDVTNKPQVATMPAEQPV